jgi:hypothetical protein
MIILPENFVEIEDLDGNKYILNPANITGVRYHKIYRRNLSRYTGFGQYIIEIEPWHDITEVFFNNQIVLTKQRFKIV